MIKANKDAEKSKKAASKDDHASGHALFLNTLKGHGDSVHSVAWNTEGTQIATACEVGCAKLISINNKDEG